MNIIFLYASGFIVLIWGVAHLFPTKAVVGGFGDISKDNKQIITMEWVIEGLALIFLGFLTILITLINPTMGISRMVYWSIAGMLCVLSVVSLFTGFKVNFLPFKLCPFIFIGSVILIILGLLI